jgi:hypothetical protein
VILDGTVRKHGDHADWRGLAVFSRDEVHRYYLEREFRQPLLEQLPGLCLFGMLNPSTADESRPDPTTSRCATIAKLLRRRRWGVVNMFGVRATKPSVVRQMLAAGTDADGEHNREAWRIALEDVRASGGVVVCAWGAHAWAVDRARAFTRLALEGAGAGRLRIVQLTQDGHPGHPLYTPSRAWPTSPWLDAPAYAAAA